MLRNLYAAVLLVALPFLGQQASDQVPSSSEVMVIPGSTLAALSIVKIRVNPDTPAFSIAFDYNFPGRSYVHIVGLGIVPAKGRFRYLSLARSIEFRDVVNGDRLGTLPLIETAIVAAKPPLNEVPSESQFPEQFRSFQWESSDSFHVHADAVLGRYFRYLPSERNHTTYIVTTFAPLQLQNLPSGVLGQVALLLSFPYNKNSGSYSFHIQSLVREGRTHSEEYRPTSRAEIIRASDKLVDGLVTELQGRVNKNP